MYVYLAKYEKQSDALLARKVVVRRRGQQMRKIFKIRSAVRKASFFPAASKASVVEWPSLVF